MHAADVDSGGLILPKSSQSGLLCTKMAQNLQIGMEV